MYTRAFTPIDIAGVRIKNRIVRTPHVTHFAGDGISEQFIAFHLARARGGVGLSVLEAQAVHPSSVFHNKQLKSFDDGVVDGYRRLMDVIEPTGMRVFQQIWHGGFQYGSLDGDPPIAPSPLPGPFAGVPAVAMTKAHVRMITHAFVAAAERVHRGGLHGVELACAHGYLLQQFLSRWSNQRTDDYGGTLENRARIIVEVATGIRQLVPRSFPIGLRIGPEAIPGGLSPEDVIEAVRHLEQTGLFDYINMSVGNYQNLIPSLPAVQDPAGAELPLVGPVARATQLVSIVTGRYRLIDEVEQALRDGVADLIGMTRAHIADPDIVRKTLEGRETEIRSCIGCNQMCVAGMFSPSGEVKCTINAHMSCEFRIPERDLYSTDVRKHVLVVGGGPAGMEAARIAAQRGHRVTLHEASPDLGGAVRLAVRAPHLAGLGDITRWQESEIFRLGVSVQTGSYLEADEVGALDPDIVIVATGSMPRSDGLQIGLPGLGDTGLGHSSVLSSWDVLADDASVTPGTRFVVFDDTGHFEATALAEYIVARGGRVEVITRFASLATQMDLTMRSGPAMYRLNASGRYTLHTFSFVAGVDAAAAEVTVNSLIGQPPQTLTYHKLVYVGYNRATGAEFEAALRARGWSKPVRVIGDARSARYLPGAIHDGFFSGLEC